MNLAVAFSGGVLTLFAPCAALMLPGFFAYACAQKRYLFARTALFTLGLILALIPLGVLAGSAGALLRANQYFITAVLGGLIIVLGIWQALALPFPHFGRRPEVAPVGLVSGVSLGSGTTGSIQSAQGTPKAQSLKTAQSGANPLAVLGLGVAYGLAGVGCSGPILGAMLAFASFEGSALSGAFLMLAYALGVATPIVILTFLWESLQIGERGFLRPRPLKILGRWTTRGAFISGILFVLLGILLIVTGGHNFLPAVISTQTQVSLEVWLLNTLSGIPSWLFGLLLATVIVSIWVWRRYYR
ncbi:cytochrome c biogenesis CcdA family protein [Actinomycetaceae bacterium TAE3-ERU4]|nr:cytochrome c biogenesis CcdA family protein [Actinomycetaceae bacterium TAE3-ERU4]